MPQTTEPPICAVHLRFLFTKRMGLVTLVTLVALQDRQQRHEPWVSLEIVHSKANKNILAKSFSGIVARCGTPLVPGRWGVGGAASKPLLHTQG